MLEVNQKLSEPMLQIGRKIGGKYVVEELLGVGVEGEVYKVRDIRINIMRAAKVFYPLLNEREKLSIWYAKKLDKLRNCSAVLQYLHVETIKIRRTKVICFISEYLDGILLADFVSHQSGKRLAPFQALHLVYEICQGLEEVHAHREYHGDLHASNIFVKRRGIFFEVKLIDLYQRGRTTVAERQNDVIDVVHLLYDMVGGRKHYAKQPREIKSICLGLRRDLITRKFPSVSHLRSYLESFTWYR
jgi:serine/threonine protein kinase